MAFWSWSRTPSSNATADATINWAEGQAPSSVNDSARSMMARTAEYRDDISGAIVTGGTSTAYTVTSYEVFDTLAHLNGQMIAFTPHTTNAATVTLNVDGLGAKPLRTAPSTELLAGVLIQGTPYVATYNNSDAAWYLRGFFGNPYNIPLGGMLPFVAATAPNSSFVLPYGQAISRTTYAALFALTGTNYGAGDGSTTFNVPDLRGRVLAGSDAMGGSAANRLTTASGMTTGTIGGTGGAETQTLTAAQIPTITSSGTNSISVTSSLSYIQNHANGYTTGTGPGSQGYMFNNTSPASEVSQVTATGNNSIGVTSNNTSGNAHSNVQPTIVGAYILRVI